MTDNFKVNDKPTNFPDVEQESSLSLYKKHNPDRNMFNLVDSELIKLSGSKIYLYKYMDSKEYDPVYMESRNKPIMTEPVILFGHYEPMAVEEKLSQFGLELESNQIFVFNKSYVEKTAGRIIKPGDILEPAFQKIRYEIFEVQEDSFESYGVYHLVCQGKVLRDNIQNQTLPITDTSDRVGGIT